MNQDPAPRNFGASKNLRAHGTEITLKFGDVFTHDQAYKILYSLIEGPSDIYFDRDSEFPFEPTEAVIEEYLKSLKDDELIVVYGVIDTGFGGMPLISVVRHLEDFRNLKEVFYERNDPLAFSFIGRVKFEKVLQNIDPKDLISNS